MVYPLTLINRLGAMSKSSKPLDPQQLFTMRYISSSEIQQRVGVSRSSVMKARNSGLLPEPIRIPGLMGFVWERHVIGNTLTEWKTRVDARKARLANA